MNLIHLVEKFLKTLETRTDFEELIPFYHPDVEQIEYPNLLTIVKTCRSLDDLRDAAEKGKGVLQSEKYEIINKYTSESVVIVEVVWRGVLGIPIGKLKPGDTMKAYFAQFYEFKDGRIIRQRNYDCFEHFK